MTSIYDKVSGEWIEVKPISVGTMLNICRSLPKKGTTTQRKAFLFFSVDVENDRGRTVRVQVNYHCLDKYSEEQRVEYLGYSVMIWHQTDSLDCRTGQCDDANDITTVIQRLHQELDERCDHQWEHDPDGPNAMCLHSSRCTVCGEKRTIDSSG